ncbi:MAG: hypothetical protein VR72_16390 [Clostridiaceae bacterium BRH_c20a]|nr:MAG: hypothetical protein VR72_16390 [Clostridiaceae bacterium BRH_c20a]
MKNKLSFALEKEGFSLTIEQLDKFIMFSSLIKEWNTKINLTSLDEDDDIIYKHFLDSLFCLKTGHDWQGKKIIDVGTGAGFPGIPLKIILGDDIELTLFDSVQKKVNFLGIVVKELGLKGVKCIHGRAEEYGKMKDYREKYDIVLARAVARLPLLLELCMPFVNLGGFFIAMKGPEGTKELDESEYALNQLGGKYNNINKFFLKDQDYTRVLISFGKNKLTPGKYPRKAGVPQKKPLLKDN